MSDLFTQPSLHAPFAAHSAPSPRTTLASTLATTLDATVAALSTLRISLAGLSETALVDRMSDALTAAGIGHHREVRLAPRCRIDLAVPVPGAQSCIGIEAKKGRPRAPDAAAQVERYAATGRVDALIFVAERAFDLPETLSGIPIRTVSLNTLMGIAL